MSEARNGNQQHIYYQLCFSLQSSLLIGNGLNRHTDNDVLLNAEGKPFIPGTTVAGMLREMAGEDADELFGMALKDDQGSISSLYVSDAVTALERDQIHLSKRDNVALDEYKTALDQKKFDYEVIEPDIDFIGLIEIDKNVPARTKEKAEALLKRLIAQGCAFGAKKTRGMGRMAVTIRKIAFDFSQDQEVTAWLDFDPFQPDQWKDAKQLSGEQAAAADTFALRILLRQKGGLSIRVYTTELEDVDYRTIRYQKDQESVLVPGTTWAGAFRARVREFLPESDVADLFGDVLDAKYAQKQENDPQPAAETSGKPTAWRSKVTFSETRISGGFFKQITRNAIDRFSGKTKDSALYSEETYYGGAGELLITLPAGDRYAPMRQAVGAAVADLHHGFLSVGGLTAVGRGLFEIQAGGLLLNGVSVDVTKEGWENDFLKKLGKAGEADGND